MRLYFESIAVVGAQPKPSVPTHKFESNKKGENGGTPTRKLDNFSRLPRRSPSVVFDQARFKAYTKKGVFGCFLRIHSLVSYPKRSSTALICLSGFKAITENILYRIKQGSRSARLSPQSMIHYARKLFIIVFQKNTTIFHNFGND